MRFSLLVLTLLGTAIGQTVPSDAPRPDQVAQTEEEQKQPAQAGAETPGPVATGELDDNSPPAAEPVPQAQSQQMNPPTNPVEIPTSTAAATAAQADSPDSLKARDIVAAMLNVLIGLIAANVARRKGRTFWVWWVYGAFLWPIAIIHAFMLKTQAQLQAESETRARAGAAAEARRQAAIARLAQIQQSGDDGGYFREKLRQYSHHSPCECMECGYSGNMGIVDRKRPLHENGLVQFGALMGNGAAKSWYAASATLGSVAKNILECPNCGNKLEQETGSRPTMVMIGR